MINECSHDSHRSSGLFLRRITQFDHASFLTLRTTPTHAIAEKCANISRLISIEDEEDDHRIREQQTHEVPSVLTPLLVYFEMSQSDLDNTLVDRHRRIEKFMTEFQLASLFA